MYAYAFGGVRPAFRLVFLNEVTAPGVDSELAAAGVGVLAGRLLIARVRPIGSPAAQESALRWLATCVATGSAQREIELWKVVKTGRELRCVARYLPAGIDLRLMQGQEFRRTELHRDADAATAKAAEWKAALLERGWRDL